MEKGRGITRPFYWLALLLLKAILVRNQRAPHQKP